MLLGIGRVLSFNVLADFKVDGSRTIFEFVDHVSQNIMLPLGGLLIAVFSAYVLPKAVVKAQLGIENTAVWWLWKLLIGLVAPVGVLIVFVVTVFPCAQTLSCFGG